MSARLILRAAVIAAVAALAFGVAYALAGSSEDPRPAAKADPMPKDHQPKPGVKIAGLSKPAKPPALKLARARRRISIGTATTARPVATVAPRPQPTSVPQPQRTAVPQRTAAPRPTSRPIDPDPDE